MTRRLRCAAKTLSFEHPLIMGVLNITPDSFSDGGAFFGATTDALEPGAIDLDKVLHQAQAMLADGAAVLDIGGESTRPGAATVSIDEELARVIPVVEKLNSLDTILSVDTRHVQVATAALEAGATMINDVSAGADAGMLDLVAKTGVGYALMHMQGTPATMQRAPRYESVVVEVTQFLHRRYTACLERGIGADQLMLDPGFGFGKSLQHNLQLLAHIGAVRIADAPILAGLSRKSMLGTLTGRGVEERSYASVAAAMLAVQNGADMVRVHDVAATQDMLKVFTSVNAVL